jgi:hypothetical protein
MMLENNRRQVFDVIRAWIDQKVPARTSTSAGQAPIPRRGGSAQ